jgi:DNA invertase Pin-like site-specific DNA recombinase
MTTRQALLFVRAMSMSEPTAPRLHALRLLAAQRAWTISGEFVATPARRKDRDNLLAAVRSGAHGAGVIVVPALSHLGTTIREVVLLADDLLGRGWDLVCHGDKIDTTEADGRAVIVGMLANIAALDRAGTLERARAARTAIDQARLAGRPVGRRRREVPVQQVFEMLSEGKSWREIGRLTKIPPSTLHAAMKQSEVALQPPLSVLEAA